MRWLTRSPKRNCRCTPTSRRFGPILGFYSLGSYRDRLPRAEQAGYYEGMVRFVSRYVAARGAEIRAGNCRRGRLTACERVPA